jgi:8-oxo-dGTP diphosphatase
VVSESVTVAVILRHVTGGVVVGAAVFLEGRVLAARRSRPSNVAGRWEFPGGKVELGESETQALVRELQEELAMDVAVGEEIGRVRLGKDGQLVVFACQLAGDHPRLSADHDELRWLSGRDLSSVDWLDADRLLLANVAAVLASSSYP